MYSKFQRDYQVRKENDVHRRMQLSGYLQEDAFGNVLGRRRSRMQATQSLDRPGALQKMGEDESVVKLGIESPAPATHGGGRKSGMSQNLDTEEILDPLTQMINKRNKKKTALSQRSNMRMQTWLSKIDPDSSFLNQLEHYEKPMIAKVSTHSFRDRDSSKDIDTKAFRIKGACVAKADRMERALKDAQSLLSSGEKLRNQPFIFRAHQPLMSTTQGFLYKANNEVSRVQDQLSKNEKFENASFDRELLVTGDLHRTTKQSCWINPKGFDSSVNRLGTRQFSTVVNSSQLTPRGDDANENVATRIEPFKDPNPIPGFVRTTQEYLKTAKIMETNRKIKELERQAAQITMPGSKSQRQNTQAQSDFKIADRTSSMDLSGLSFMAGGGGGPSDFNETQTSQKGHRKNLSVPKTSRKPFQFATLDTSIKTQNSFFDTYQKMQQIQTRLKQRGHIPKAIMKNTGQNMFNSKRPSKGLYNIPEDDDLAPVQQSFANKDSLPSQILEKSVNFSIESPQGSLDMGMGLMEASHISSRSHHHSKSPIDTSPANRNNKARQPPTKVNLNLRNLGKNVPENFQKLSQAKIAKSKEKEASLEDTLTSFFDSNKLYIKTAQNAKVMRRLQKDSSHDRVFDQALNLSSLNESTIINKQEF